MAKDYLATQSWVLQQIQTEAGNKVTNTFTAKPCKVGTGGVMNSVSTTVDIPLPAGVSFIFYVGYTVTSTDGSGNVIGSDRLVKEGEYQYIYSDRIWVKYDSISSGIRLTFNNKVPTSFSVRCVVRFYVD